MSEENVSKYQKKIITIPNILSFFRLCLIPVIVWLYCFRKDYLLTTVTLVISGLTDIADGIIARKFNMVSDFGKAFDPVADKLTQIVMMICLVTRFHIMIIPLVLLTLKEILAAVLNLLVAKKSGNVMGAVWHGKVTTVIIYSMMLIHIVWYNIPIAVSNVLIIASTVMMLYSAVQYSMRSIRVLKDKD